MALTRHPVVRGFQDKTNRPVRLVQLESGAFASRPVERFLHFPAYLVERSARSMEQMTTSRTEQVSLVAMTEHLASFLDSRKSLRSIHEQMIQEFLEQHSRERLDDCGTIRLQARNSWPILEAADNFVAVSLAASFEETYWQRMERLEHAAAEANLTADNWTAELLEPVD